MSAVSSAAANLGGVKELEIKAKWDEHHHQPRIDVDLAVGLYNGLGQLLDLGCFNQTSIANGSVTMSGDRRDGSQKGADETAKVYVSLLPPEVQIVLIIVTIATEKITLSQLKKFSLSIESLGVKKNFLETKDVTARSFIPFAFVRTPTKFDFLDIEHSSSSYGLENIWTMCDQVLSKLIDPVLWSERPQLKFDLKKLKKGQEVMLPNPHQIVKFGLGWDAAPVGGRKIDLDSWIYMMVINENGVLEIKETINFSHKISSNHSIRHGGDNLTGEGDGDDEVIKVDLNKVPKEISALVAVVKIFTPCITFGQVKNEYIRIIGADDKVVARYDLDGDASFKSKNCGIFCILRRVAHSWRLEPMAVASDNDSYFERNLSSFVQKTFKK